MRFSPRGSLGIDESLSSGLQVRQCRFVHPNEDTERVLKLGMLLQFELHGPEGKRAVGLGDFIVYLSNQFSPDHGRKPLKLRKNPPLSNELQGKRREAEPACFAELIDLRSERRSGRVKID